MKDKILISGAILMLFGVIIGAFGAHSLEETLKQNARIETYETATKYLFYHSIGMLILAVVYKENRYHCISFWTMLAGVVIFSGSLYILSITNITFFGAVTPIGGLLLILSWIFFILGIKKNENT